MPVTTKKAADKYKNKVAIKAFKSIQSPNHSKRNSTKLIGKRKGEEVGNLNGANPVSILNNIKNGVIYEVVEQTGSPHNPTFKVCVNVYDQKYYGTGRSKKAAQYEAANEALKCIHPSAAGKNWTHSVIKKKNELNSNNFSTYKNPISVINEQLTGLKYEVIEQTGPPHNPVFKICVEVYGHKYYGIGNSKKAAQYEAATKVLNCMHPPANGVIYSVNSEPNKKNNLNTEKNPISELNELINGLKYEVVEQTGPPHNPTFKICVEVYGHKYYGIGNSKKAAQYEAATKVLNCMHPPANGVIYSVNSVPNKKNNLNTEKNPISELNELINGLKYEVVEQTGPPHNPTFKISVEVGYQKCYGIGSSKQTARYQAATEALKYICPQVNGSIICRNSIPTNIKNDQSQVYGLMQQGGTVTVKQIYMSHNSSGGVDNKTNFEKCNSNKSAQNEMVTEVSQSLMTDSIVPSNKQSEINMNYIEKNPVAALNELRTDLDYKVIGQSGPPHNPFFKVSVVLENQTYYGTGKTKKLAKYNAACEALHSLIDSSTKQNNLSIVKNKLFKGPLICLRELYPHAKFTCVSNEEDPFARFRISVNINNEIFTGIGCSKKAAQEAAASSALSKLKNYVSPNVPTFSFQEIPLAAKQEQDLADAVAELIHDKFSDLMANDTVHLKRKVLAGIVMTKNSDISTAEVVCVSTGTKCISGEHISLNGASLNDMHAEILSRRCLINFFYDQLELMLSDKTSDSSVFKLKDGKAGYQLKEGVDFHLYINTAPCGDAATFGLQEENSSVDKNSQRKSEGLLRTKIEAGEGTIPIENGFTQTWDGIVQGARLRTMSCSDKICKWNVLGLQGALLSYFLEPIFIKSLIIGSSIIKRHLDRAIYGRVETALQDVPPPFLLNKPSVLRVTSINKRQPQNTPNFAVIWVLGMRKPEIVNMADGKPKEGVSIVCKQNLTDRFVTLFGKLSSTTVVKQQPLTLMEAKKSLPNYTAAKKCLYDAFSKAQLGSWISKPIEQDMFDITYSNL